MFSNYQQFPGAIPSGGTSVTVAESVLMAAAPSEVVEAPQGIIVRGYVNVTTAASGTGFSLRCRQNTLTGTQVGVTNTVTLANSASASIPFSFSDNSLTRPQQGTYVITATAAVAAGTIQDGALEVFVSDPYGAEN